MTVHLTLKFENMSMQYPAKAHCPYVRGWFQQRICGTPLLDLCVSHHKMEHASHGRRLGAVIPPAFSTEICGVINRAPVGSGDGVAFRWYPKARRASLSAVKAVSSMGMLVSSLQGSENDLYELPDDCKNAEAKICENRGECGRAGGGANPHQPLLLQAKLQSLPVGTLVDSVMEEHGHELRTARDVTDLLQHQSRQKPLMKCVGVVRWVQRCAPHLHLDPGAYLVMMRACCKASRPLLALGFYDECLAAGQHPTEHMHRMALRCCYDARDFPRFVAVWRGVSRSHRSRLTVQAHQRMLTMFQHGAQTGRAKQPEATYTGTSVALHRLSAGRNSSKDASKDTSKDASLESLFQVLDSHVQAERWEDFRAALQGLGGRDRKVAALALARLVRPCLEARTLTKALEIYKQAADCGVVATEATLTDLLRVVVNSASWPASLALLQDMIAGGMVPSRSMFARVSGACVRAGSVEARLKVQDLMLDSGVLPDNLYYERMMRVCFQKPDPHQALHLSLEMAESGLRPTPATVELLLLLLEKVRTDDDKLRRVHAVMALWQQDNAHNTSKAHCQQVLSVLHSAGAWQSCLEVYEEARTGQRAIGQRGFELVLLACAEAAQWQQALAVYEDMRQAGHVPRACSLVALLSSLAQGLQFSLLLEVFQAARPVDRRQAGTRVYALAMRACSQLRDGRRARWLMQEVHACSGLTPNTRIYNSYINCLGRSEGWAAAQQAWGEMCAAGLSSDVVTFNTLLQVCARHARGNEAEDLFKRMIDQGLEPDGSTVAALIHALDKGGEWQRGWSAYQWARQRGVPLGTPTVIHVLSVCRRSSCWEWAVQVVADMRLEGISLEPGLCRSLMSLYQHFKQKEEGVALYQQMKLEDIPLETPALNSLVSLCVCSQEWELAIQIYEECTAATTNRAHNNVSSRGHTVPDMHTFQWLLVACASGRQTSRAAAYLAEMRDIGVRPTVGVYDTMFQMHLRSAGKGSHGRLEALYSDMREAGVFPDEATLEVLAASCARAGRFWVAMDCYTDLRSAGWMPEADMCNSLARMCAKAGAWEQALELYDSMPSGFKIDSSTFSHLISACNKAGEWQHSLRVMDDMCARGVQPNIVTFSTMMEACAGSREWRRARAVWESMRNAGMPLNLYSYQCLAWAFSAAGQWALLLEALKEMHASGTLPSIVFVAPTPSYKYYKTWTAALHRSDQYNWLTVHNTNLEVEVTLVLSRVKEHHWREIGVLFEKMQATKMDVHHVHFKYSVQAVSEKQQLWRLAMEQRDHLDVCSD